jgi:hypothetical protein
LVWIPLAPEPEESFFSAPPAPLLFQFILDLDRYSDRASESEASISNSPLLKLIGRIEQSKIYIDLLDSAA